MDTLAGTGRAGSSQFHAGTLQMEGARVMDQRIEREAEVDLVVSLPTVVAIIDAARVADELQEEMVNEPAQDPEAPEDVDPSAMVDQLKALIADLNEDEQAALIALAWTGRGDYTASQWAEARRLAQERNADGSAPAYLAEMEMLGDLLSEGLAELGMPAEAEDR